LFFEKEEDGLKKRFEFKEGNSNKFWQVECGESNKLVVCFGRIGSEGQIKEKIFKTAGEAATESAQLIKEKLKKGYQEVALPLPITQPSQMPKLQESRSNTPCFLFCIRHRGKLGFMNVSGKVVIPPTLQNPIYEQHEGAVDFSSDRVPVMTAGRWGYMDRNGGFAIPPRFEIARDFSEGRAAVGEITRRSYGIPDGRWGYIDRRGELVIPYQFAEADDFVDGRARVVVAGKGGDLVAHGGERLIDPTGTILGRPKKSEGRVALPPPTEPVVDERSGRYGFRAPTTDGSKGKMVIPFRFDDALDFSEGLAAVKVGKLWGFIDLRGELVIEPASLEGSKFCEGRAQAKVKVQLGGRNVVRYGFIDKQGRMVIDPQFTKADERTVCFEQGLAAVIVDKRRAWIDLSGKFVWKERA
jgi:predicted DNA-binding WGR domain protein